MERTSPGTVKTSDIARLMELFQSSLLRYWGHDPESRKSKSDVSTSEDTKVGHQSQHDHEKESSGDTLRGAEKAPAHPEASSTRTKRVPVIFFDEAHKLCVFPFETP